MIEPITFLDAIADALRRAGTYNKNDQVAPAAVLWPDKERQWETLLPRLRGHLPLLTLGPYNPVEKTGPAYWLRCMIARTLPDDLLLGEGTPVIYMPGISRQEIRAVEDCPKPLQPLAELQYRGVLWTQKNGRDWTIPAFVQSADGGLGIAVVGNGATKEALQRALLKLADEPLAVLGKEAPLRPAFLDALLNPDEVRRLLLWLEDPAGYRQRCDPAEWAAFCNLGRTKYGFHPVQDGEITAAQLLAQRQGAWALAWRRFAEAPAAYPKLPDLLRRARPQPPLPLFAYDESWPQDNEAAERQLRESLAEFGAKSPHEVRQAVSSLEGQHSMRRSWVWTTLGLSPLASALQHLAALAEATARPLGGTTVAEIAAAYAEWGWQVDAAVIDALSAVEHPDDVAAVRAEIQVLYRPWLEAAANAMQQAVLAGDPSLTYCPPNLAPQPPGTCLVFSDGLRFDVGQLLVAALEHKGWACQTDWHLAALPSVTATGKPAVAPVASLLKGGPRLELVVSATGATVNVDVLRKLLGDLGYQVLRGDDLGDPSGRAWTELGDIDSYGHAHGWKVAHHIAAEIRALASRISALLDHGWKRVVVVTDHGWLLLPGGLPKAQLPEHLTEVRKGRCARLKATASTAEPCVPWFWDQGVRIALARGIHCYEAGKECEHGGLSPQECVVPVIEARLPPSGVAQSVQIQSVAWKGLRCTATIIGAAPDMVVDIRTKPGDSHTSLTLAPKLPNADGSISLLVQDEDKTGVASVIVVLSADGAVRAQIPAVVGA